MRRNCNCSTAPMWRCSAREIIQFATAALISPGIYRLSTLLRGRLGTEMFISSHALGERFVVLNEAVVPLVVPANTKGQSWTLLTTTVGANAMDGVTNVVPIEGNSLKPYSPVDVQAVRSGSGDVTISWIRRARIDGGMRDYVDIPQKEANELYEVSIFSEV